MPRRYAVDLVRDDPALLRDRLDAIAGDGGKIVSVMWTPSREVLHVSSDGKRVMTNVQSGYTVVSENDFPDQAGG